MTHIVGWRLLAWLALVLTGLVGCAPTGPLSSKDDPLAPYEAAAWPGFLTRLALPADRDYVVLAYLPSAVPFDLGSPERLRASLATLAAEPGRMLTAKTLLGHAMVAWQCGETRGVTSMTGERAGQGNEMVQAGWGLVPFVSTYNDGWIVPEAAFAARHDLALSQGRGAVVATEVDRTACEALRDRLRRFVTDPRQPGRRFSLIRDPAAGEGGGCLTFAWYLAEAAGVMPGMSRAFRRPFPVFGAAIGRGAAVPAGVELVCPGGCDPDRAPLSPSALVSRPWTGGPVVAEYVVPDGELFLAALVAMRTGSAGADDWRRARVLAPARADIRGAAAFGGAHAARFAMARIADPGGVEALVLERR